MNQDKNGEADGMNLLNLLSHITNALIDSVIVITTTSSKLLPVLPLHWVFVS